MAILQDVSNRKSLEQQIEELRAQNEAMKAKLASRSPSVSFKVTEKGGVSMYGLGRFPVTLYLSQWQKLLKAIPDLEAYLEDNIDRLTTKDD
jgi:ABC-type Fe3+-hydroxamate transport system substrate-binding protein